MLDRARLAGRHDVQFHFYKLFYLAIDSHQLRSLAPAAIEQRICGHNTRCSLPNLSVQRLKKIGAAESPRRFPPPWSVEE